MISTPSSLCLPKDSVAVEDVDEELFLVYTRKLQLDPTSSSEGAGGCEGKSSTALGQLGDKDGVLHVTVTVEPPGSGHATSVQTLGKSRRTARNKARETKDVVVEVEVHQALDALRHRKGDTGSVLWRTSVHLAQYLLQAHHFRSASSSSPPPLLPSLASSTILELGSGTGFLGLALRSIWNERGRWIFSDQLENLPLVARNLRANGVVGSAGVSVTSSSSTPSSAVSAGSPGSTAPRGSRTIASKPRAASLSTEAGRVPQSRVEVVELDWLAEAAAWDRQQPGSLDPATSAAPPRRRTPSHPSMILPDPPDVILACDCVYNPSLSAPLAKTILRQAGRHTVVLVACELRDEDPVEEFLRSWMSLGEKEGWKVVRLEWDEEERRTLTVGGISAANYVVCVGWRDGTARE